MIIMMMKLPLKQTSCYAEPHKLTKCRYTIHRCRFFETLSYIQYCCLCVVYVVKYVLTWLRRHNHHHHHICSRKGNSYFVNSAIQQNVEWDWYKTLWKTSGYHYHTYTYIYTLAIIMIKDVLLLMAKLFSKLPVKEWS